MIKTIIFLTLFICTPHYSYSDLGGNFTTFWHKQFPHNFRTASLFIEKISITCDIPFELNEFTHLTNLHEQAPITLQNIQQAYQALLQKNRFSRISFNVSLTPQTTLLVSLESFWIFNKLIISGINQNRERYTALYKLQEGDVFNATAHETSVEAIREELYNEGYFNNQLQDTLEYSGTHKMITPHLAIKRNKVFIIRKIMYESTDRSPYTPSEKVKTKLQRLLLNKRYNHKLITQAVEEFRSFLKKEGFLHPRISFKKRIYKDKRSIHLIFTIEQGVQKHFLFEGNKFFTEKYIKESIIGQDEPTWLLTPDLICTQLTHEYYKQGYWDTSIVYTKNNNNHDIVFNIKEGSPIILDSITLLDQHTQKAEPIEEYTQHLKQERYKKEALDKLVTDLTLSYQKQGFWDAIITGPFLHKNNTTGLYQATLYLEKGAQRIWGGYSINTPLLASDLTNLFTHYPDVKKTALPFNYQWLQEQQHILTEYLHKKGYWYAHITYALQEIDDHQSIDSQKAQHLHIQWRVTPGNKVVFGKAIIRGTSNVPIQKILQEIRFTQGETWSNEKIDLTRKQLKNLDVFKSIRIYPLDVSDKTSEKPLIIFLSDEDRIEMRARIGYFYTSKNFTFKQESTPTLGGSWTIRNLTNQADKLTVEGDWSHFERQYVIDYQQPSFLFPKLTAKGRIYNHKYVHPIQIASNESAYEASKDGLLLGLSKECQNNYFVSITIGNEWIRTSRIRGFLHLNESLIEKTIPYFFIEPSILQDKRNSQTKTTSGSLGFISCKLMIPESHGTLTASLLAEQSFYKSFYDEKLTLAARGRIGHIFRRTFDHIMPIERFYLGGPYTVRGYEKDTVPPFGVTEKDLEGHVIQEYTAKSFHDEPPNQDVIREYTIQGGSSMLNLNVELRFHPFDPLSVVFFQDIGILSQSGFTDFRETFYPTSGVGVRYHTPIGALRFDIGWKWKKLFKQENSFGWHLTLGQSF